MKCPAEVYQPSARPYTGLPDIDYLLHDKTIVVTRCGWICLGKKKINFSTVLMRKRHGRCIHLDRKTFSYDEKAARGKRQSSRNSVV